MPPKMLKKLPPKSPPKNVQNVMTSTKYQLDFAEA